MNGTYFIYSIKRLSLYFALKSTLVVPGKISVRVGITVLVIVTK